MPAENKGYVLYGLEFAKVWELFDTVFEGRVLTVGAQLDGESVEHIYAGQVVVSDADMQQAKQCVRELLALMQAKLKQEAETDKRPTER